MNHNQHRISLFYRAKKNMGVNAHRLTGKSVVQSFVVAPENSSALPLVSVVVQERNIANMMRIAAQAQRNAPRYNLDS